MKQQVSKKKPTLWAKWHYLHTAESKRLFPRAGCLMIKNKPHSDILQTYSHHSDGSTLNAQGIASLKTEQYWWLIIYIILYLYILYLCNIYYILYIMTKQALSSFYYQKHDHQSVLWHCTHSNWHCFPLS